MCGICGKIAKNRDVLVAEELLFQMNDALTHRGPDASGIYVAQHVGLGHRRLSIIDLVSGQQPMSNARQDVHIVFNGEIYNFQELRRELHALGHVFRTTSDTEVILELYDRHGASCVTHLRGMFAFAIWDDRRQRLFLARDRVGKKPLFYTLTPTALLFASEIKAILCDSDVPRALNLDAMHDYLTYQYVPPPETIFQGIFELPPAHTLVYENGQISVSRYWDLRYVPKLTMREDDILERLRELLCESVKMRMIADVPIGAFLSGGIDSSLIVALMSHYSERPVKTFSIGFLDDQFNELPYARIIAQRFGTEHHEEIVTPDAVSILPELIHQFDQPFGDSSAIPTYYLAKMTKQFVKVALNGDGGDESFAGYRRYRQEQILAWYSVLPESLRRRVMSPLLDASARQTFQTRFPRFDDVFFRRARYIHNLSLQPRDAQYIKRLSIFTSQQKLEIYSEELRQRFAARDSIAYMRQFFQAENADDFLDKMLYADVSSYLPGDLLVKVDRMTMAHGLEGRSPLLDHQLMEFAAAIPTRLKIRHGQLKLLLKQVGSAWLPPEILSRPKQGFGVPISRWFRHDLREMSADTLLRAQIVADGLFDGSAIRQLWQDHDTGKRDYGAQLWALLNLELWYRMFIRPA